MVSISVASSWRIVRGNSIIIGGSVKGKWELRPYEKTGQDRGGMLNMERRKACRLTFWSKSLQRVVTMGKGGGGQWPHSELSSCFSWESVATGALLKTVAESAGCWVCRTLLLLLCRLSFLRSGRRLGFRPSSLLCKQSFLRFCFKWTSSLYRAPLKSQAVLWGCPSFSFELCVPGLALPANEAWPLSSATCGLTWVPCWSLGTCVGHWVSRSVSGQCASPGNWARHSTSLTKDLKSQSGWNGSEERLLVDF